MVKSVQFSRKFFFTTLLSVVLLTVGPSVLLLAGEAEAVRERDAWTDQVTGMEFVWVKEGCFSMGCGSWMQGCEDHEKPAHEVCVNGFFLGRYEVTQGQWNKVMGTTPARSSRGDRYPVESVSFDEAQDFVGRMSAMSGYPFRLPSEAEWEFACRSGGKEQRFCGDDDIKSISWYAKNSRGATNMVGSRLPNEIGLYDMTGNVWEWCADWYNEFYYGFPGKDNPSGPNSGTYRIIRGGSWNSFEENARSTVRLRLLPQNPTLILGFRLAMPGKP